MALPDGDVARHETGHWVVGVVNGFPMSYLILIPSAEGGFTGRAGYETCFTALASDELRRAAIRTCLAGEAARGVQRLEDFLEEASTDLDLARRIAAEVAPGIDELLEDELERTLLQVDEHAAKIDAVVDELMATVAKEGEYRSLSGVSAAKAMGWIPVRDGNTILRFVPGLPA